MKYNKHLSLTIIRYPNAIKSRCTYRPLAASLLLIFHTLRCLESVKSTWWRWWDLWGFDKWFRWWFSYCGSNRKWRRRMALLKSWMVVGVEDFKEANGHSQEWFDRLSLSDLAHFSRLPLLLLKPSFVIRSEISWK